MLNTGDTAWMIVATALVLLMTLPGLALFYGGLVRSRNVLSVFMQCMSLAALMSVLWLIAGYSIALAATRPTGAGSAKPCLPALIAAAFRAPFRKCFSSPSR